MFPNYVQFHNIQFDLKKYRYMEYIEKYWLFRQTIENFLKFLIEVKICDLTVFCFRLL